MPVPVQPQLLGREAFYICSNSVEIGLRQAMGHPDDGNLWLLRRIWVILSNGSQSPREISHRKRTCVEGVLDWVLVISQTSHKHGLQNYLCSPTYKMLSVRLVVRSRSFSR